MTGELLRQAAELAHLAHNPRLPAWLARALSWTAADLMAEAQRQAAEAGAPPAVANDNLRHAGPPAA